MSNLLRDAIVDARALREAALKNAETTVIDKYSEEVRQTLSRLLEQEEDPMADLMADPMADPMAGGGEAGAETAGTGEVVAEDIPLAATDNFSDNEGENLKGLPQSGKPVDVEINLDALQEAVQHMQNEQEIDIDEDNLRELLSKDDLYLAEMFETSSGDAAGLPLGKRDEDEDLDEEVEAEAPEATTEELQVSNELINSIVEELTVDLGADLSGWAGRPSSHVKYEMEKELAHRRSTEVEEELKILKKAQEELVFENSQLKESLEQHKQAVQELQEATRDVNLSNARLLYTNRVLRNTSLNERQKSKIADAISEAGSITEAKTIYQTLESTVESSPKRGPQSLSEAIGRQRTSVIRASRRESTPSDPHMDRMKKLAGIL